MPGFNNIDFNHGLVLSLLFDEENGANAVFNDRSSSRHQIAAGSAIVRSTPAASELPVIDFDQAVPDFLKGLGADTGALDFDTSPFGLSAWIRVESFTDDVMIMCRGLSVTDGWRFYVETTGRLHIVTAQGGAEQDTYSALASIALATWYHVMATRDGADCLVVINGVDATEVAGAHVDPLVNAARDFYVGVYDDEASYGFDGMMWKPQAWNKKPEVAQAMDMLQVEGHWFGV